MIPDMTYPRGIVIASFAMALAACSVSDGNDEIMAPSGTPVRVHQVELDIVEETERSMGRSESFATPTVSAEVSGRVERIAVDVGDRVEADAVLAELDATPYELSLAAADADVAALGARVRQLQNELDRIRAVGDGQYVSASDLEAAEAGVETIRQELAAARNRMEEARRQLENTRIRAPLAGRVDARRVSEGDFVSSGDAMFRLLPDASSRVRLSFPEVVGDRLREGMPVRLRRLGRVDDEPVEGILSRIRPSVDGGMAVVAVVEFLAPDSWQSGTMLEGWVILDRREGAVMVPTGAIVDRPGRKVVFVLTGDADSGEVEERVVTLGLRRPDRTEILDGVEPGERVVVDGAPYLGDGTRVRLRSAE